MLTEVAAFLNRKGDRDHIGQFVLISDSLTNGGFLIHHYVTQALKDGHLLYLVSFAQSFIHYNSIATKLGVNLSKCEQAGQFVFVDCLTKLLEGCCFTEAATKRPQVTVPHAHLRLTYSLDSDFSLKGLYHLLQDSVRQLKPDRPVCLVIDDLSVVLSVGVGVREVGDFVHYCQQLLCAPDGVCKGEGYLVAMVHSDSDCNEGEGEGLLHTHLLHCCHLSLHVEGLRTGCSKEVHGELTAEWRSPEQPSPSSSPQRKHSQFKTTEKTVQLFARGTSRVVL